MLQKATDLDGQLHNLRIFLAVADAKSVAGASAQLFKASSAITRSIIELERAMGAPLFERSQRGMLLNAAGKVVLTRARRIAEEIELAADEFLKVVRSATRPSRHAIVNVLFSGRKLALLIGLVERRSLSAVAAEMSLTQAGASMALARMEAAFGQPVFQRRMEGMLATEAAERLALRARRVLAELRHLVSDLAAATGAQPTGAVVIGATHLGRTHYLPAGVAAAVSRHPGLRVTFVEGSYEPLVAKLKSGEIDVLLTVLRPQRQCPGLVSERLFTDGMSVLARSGHPLARRSPLDMEELLGERWILPRSHAMGTVQAEACFAGLGLAAPTPAIETGDLATLRQLLCASDMLAVTSPHQLSFEIETGLLVELPVPLPGVALDIGMMVREGALLSPAALAVVDAVRAQADGRQAAVAQVGARRRPRPRAA
jgi:LysR family transcriptional regulator of gallate degradation